VIGNGCVVHLPSLLDEMHELRKNGIEPKGRFFISDRAHLLFAYHMQADKKQEERRGVKIGTTCRGIGPAYEDKASRRGIRAGELLSDFGAFAAKLRQNADRYHERHGITIDIEAELTLYRDLAEAFDGMIIDTAAYLHQSLATGKKMLIEGAQGAMLDTDLGTYPFVTSSNTTVSGASSGTGIPPNRLDFALGVLKAYTTRVGEGPFPSELTDETGARLREAGHEFGSTTGRPRRCGWFDAVVARHAARITGADAWNLTKLDVLTGLPVLRIVTGYLLDGQSVGSFPADSALVARMQTETIELPGWHQDISACRRFEDLPENAQDYCRQIEKLTQVPIHSIGVGADRDAIILVR
jgi:adenylosuccinate synthase